MKKIILIFVLLLMVLFYGCVDDDNFEKDLSAIENLNIGDKFNNLNFKFFTVFVQEKKTEYEKYKVYCQNRVDNSGDYFVFFITVEPVSKRVLSIWRKK